MYDVFRRARDPSTALKIAARDRPDWLTYSLRWSKAGKCAEVRRSRSAPLPTTPQHLVAMMISSRGILY